MEKAANGRDIFTDEIAGEIVAACGSGFTIEKAGALVGINPSTIRTWCQRRPAFAREVETARKKHELGLLRDIQAAGEKSWQAKAWMAERIYHHAVPSARLQVTQEHNHGISGNLAQLLAGIAMKKRTQVIDCQPIAPKLDEESLHNSYCATDATQTIATTTLAKLGKARHVRMRTRKPRSRPVIASPTTTPHATPPAPVYHA